MRPGEAIEAARQLYADFNSHDLLLLRRSIRARKLKPDMQALGLPEYLKDVVPYCTDTPNEEAYLFATAVASAEPSVSVYVQSEQMAIQGLGQDLENFWDAALTALLPDDYENNLHACAEGYRPNRIDIKEEFRKGAPERDSAEQAVMYNKRADDYRKQCGLPVELVGVDPAAFVWEQDKRGAITVGVEWGKRKRSVIDSVYEERLKSSDDGYGPVVPEADNSGGDLVDFCVVRSDTMVYHILMDGTGGTKQDGDRVLYEGPNPFGPHTGYIMWRGRYTGFSQPEERYEPYIMPSLSVAQHWNLLSTLRANSIVASAQHWEEQDLPSMGQAGPLRAVGIEAKTADATNPSGAAATLEPGTRVRWREELVGSLDGMMDRLEMEADRYRFKDVLMGEGSSGESGRSLIRRQEAASRMLNMAYKNRKRAYEEVVGVLRNLLFKGDYLKDGRSVYAPKLVEGLGDEGELRTEDVIAITEKHRIPHQIVIEIASVSQAAQLALNDEGRAMKGELSRDTIQEDYYRIKNRQLENRKLAKDEARATVYPLAIQRAVTDLQAALAEKQAELQNEYPALPQMEEQQQSLELPGVTDAAMSAMPSPPQPEDTALMVSSNGAGAMPEAGPVI